MMLVVDASVALKWVLGHRPDEADVERAISIADSVRARQVGLLQPPHWLAEVLGVLARLRPDAIGPTLTAIEQLEAKVDASWEAHRLAAEVAVRLDHHVFDTLYHAVAVINDCMLVTADRRYFVKARDLGHIVLLRDVPGAVLRE
jgi:predicted nucleic acid-binding protein